MSSFAPNKVIDLNAERCRRGVRGYSEHRVEARVDTGERVFAQVVEATDPSLVGLTMICKGIDTSAHGMKIRTNRLVTAGSAVDLWVEVPGEQRKLFLASHVRWCKRLQFTEEPYELGLVLHGGAGTDISIWRKLKAV